MTNAEIKALSDEDIVSAELSEDKKLVAYRFDQANNQNVPALAIRKSRKLIARFHTELRRRELERDLPKGSLYASLVGGQSAANAEQDGASGFLSDLTAQADN